MRGFLAILAGDRRGTSLIEFAILLPVFTCLLFGVMGYGQYFLLAHSVQELANDAARATVAGMSADERRTLATGTVSAELQSLNELNPAKLSTSVSETSDLVTVHVTYDASATPIFRNTLAPMPDPVIVRSAVVRPGGIS